MQRRISQIINKWKKSFIGEYLLGTRTFKRYEDEAKLYREFQQHCVRLDRYDHEVMKKSLRFFILGRGVPLILDGYFIASALATDDPKALLPMAVTGIYRSVATKFAKRGIEDLVNMRNMLQESWDSSQKGTPESVLGYLGKEECNPDFEDNE